MPKVSAERSQQRRLQILDAASRCFAKKGLHRTTMQDICKKARLSPGAVYCWFPSKQAIIAEMTRRSVDSFAAAMRQAERNPRAALRSYLAIVRQATAVSMVGWMNIHLVSESASDKYLRRVLRQVTRGGVVALERALANLSPGKRGTAKARARLLQAAGFGIVIQSLLSPDDAASFDLAERLIADG